MNSNARKKGLLFIISAPSGAGKTTISNVVIGKLGKIYPISRVITYTSRQPRNNEVDGIDYFFISKDDFVCKQKEDFFLETTEYNEQCYGSPRFILNEIENGKFFIIITDINGAKSLSSKVADAVLIWLAPPSYEILKNRLIKRATETTKEIEHRIALSKKEMQQERDENFFEYRIINDSFEKAAEELCLLIENKINNR